MYTNMPVPWSVPECDVLAVVRKLNVLPCTAPVFRSVYNSGLYGTSGCRLPII